MNAVQKGCIFSIYRLFIEKQFKNGFVKWGTSYLLEW